MINCDLNNIKCGICTEESIQKNLCITCNKEENYYPKIDEEIRNVVVKYDDRIAYYISKDLSDLSLAYAITVHKSQGSEYDVVIMPMARTPNQLLNRKMLYTAITRAKKCIIFVGMESYFNDMLKNKNDVIRNSALCSKLYLYNI